MSAQLQEPNTPSRSIMVVEDDAALRGALSDTLTLCGHRVTAISEGRQALRQLKHESVDLVVSDIKMAGMDGRELLRQIKQRSPELPVLLMTAYGTIQDAVAAMHEGAADYLVKPFEAETLVAKVDRFLPPGDAQLLEPIAEDPTMQAALALAKRVAGSDATVLLTGSSGTGKEVVARYLHQNSTRQQGPFVALNCAAIPDNMLEAMLFGYEKGAFTGAYQAAPGKFEQAEGGTLLLDEISEMPLALQAKLLRVLQEREVERLGGRQLIELDVRVIATTNRQLKKEVAAGRFREDLYFRLSVFPLHLPNLAQRRADIPPLANALLERHLQQGRARPAFSAAALERLQSHTWPGNVRELENVIQRALILSSGESIENEALMFEEESARLAPFDPSRDGAAGAHVAPGSASTGLEGQVRQSENEAIIEALTTANGNRKLTAEQLGISPRTLRYKLSRMREAGIEIPV